MELYQALITLDGWTFLAQICNLMIQLVIFKKFLLKPIRQVIADRKAKADSEIAVNAYNNLMDWGMQVMAGPTTTGSSISSSPLTRSVMAERVSDTRIR